jgi:thiol-disulfide isomerase/thioredoxin
MHHTRTFVLACLGAAFFALAQEIEPLPEPPSLPPREAALDTLFSIPETLPELQAALEKAAKEGVPLQPRLEARFIYHVEHNDELGIIALLPDLEKQSSAFTLDESEIFATREDFLAVVEFARAIKALAEKNNESFKKHITEALWLSPNQASAFTPYIEKMRLAEHIKTTVFSYDVQFPALSDGKPAHLQVHTEGKAATLLNFWSPWSADCETDTIELAELEPKLTSRNIALVHVLINDKTEIVSEAKAYLAGLERVIPGPQLIDRPKGRIANQLRVTDVPTLVLIAPDGKILFHGKPSDHSINQVLESIPQKAQPAIEPDAAKAQPSE